MLEVTALGTVNLTDASGKPFTTLLGQRKRLALFLYLTLTARLGPTRRDTLLPLFWPEGDDAQARRALRQILHFLRRSLGPGILVEGLGDAILVDLDVVQCDAVLFERALDAGRLAAGLERFGGDLLPGLFVTDAPEFERWLDGERNRIRERASAAAWRLAEDAADRRDVPAAEAMAGRAAALNPGDESVLCRQMDFLERVGRHSAAVRAYDRFAEYHLKEFGAPPSPGTRGRVQQLRARLAEEAKTLPARPTISSAATPTPVAEGVADQNGAAPAPLAAATSGDRRALVQDDRTGDGTRRGRAATTMASWPGIAFAGFALAAAVAIGFVVTSAMAIHTEGNTRRATTSHVARQLYDEGLHLAADADDQEAARFFHAALVEDSSFALAAFHAALSETSFDRWQAQRDFTRARRLARTASLHDALTIRQSYAAATNDPHAVLLADSLVQLFPAEPEGELALGLALSWAGRFIDAVAPLRRAILMDSAAHVGAEPPDASATPCWACRALRELAFVYECTDSLTAAERTTKEWTTNFPRDPWAWNERARVAEYEGHIGAALDYGQRENAIAPIQDEATRRARLDIRSGAFAEADVILTERARDATPPGRLDALWWEIISLRTQGRLRDALHLAYVYPTESAWRTIANSTDPGMPPMLPAAQVSFELGQYAAAATAFDSLLYHGRPESATEFYNAPGLLARHRTWIATHLATALAAAGDLTRVTALADSIHRWGRLEAYGRDRLLYEYVQGLLLEAQGDTAGAITAFRRSVYSSTEGYTRAEYEAGRLLLAIGKPGDAVAVLQPALRGNLEASNYYVTRTELHELLAHAFARAHMRDSASAHYRFVATSWQHGDPPFRARAAAARAALDSLASRH